VAAGVDAVFLEVHEEPAHAKSDAQNALRLELLEPLLHRLTAIDAVVKSSERLTARSSEVKLRG
jgi:2-dehydro-3-deoxyphosphooctonate aldolase (KDO 8-P synthase)